MQPHFGHWDLEWGRVAAHMGLEWDHIPIQLVLEWGHHSALEQHSLYVGYYTPPPG